MTFNDMKIALNGFEEANNSIINNLVYVLKDVIEHIEIIDALFGGLDTDKMDALLNVSKQAEKITDIYHRIESLEALCDELEKKNNQLGYDLEDFDNRCDGIEDKVDDLDSKMDDVGSTLYELENKTEELDSRCEDMDIDIRALDSKCDDLESRIDDIEIDDSLGEKVNDIEDKVDDLYTKVTQENTVSTCRAETIKDLKVKLYDLYLEYGVIE